MKPIINARVKSGDFPQAHEAPRFAVFLVIFLVAGSATLVAA
jgi:hypothetical protein